MTCPGWNGVHAEPRSTGFRDDSHGICPECQASLDADLDKREALRDAVRAKPVVRITFMPALLLQTVVYLVIAIVFAFCKGGHR